MYSVLVDLTSTLLFESNMICPETVAVILLDSDPVGVLFDQFKPKNQIKSSMSFTMNFLIL